MELQTRKKSNILKIPFLIFLGIVVLGFAVIFGLFHIRQVDVIGNEFYSAQEIQKMVMSDSLGENSIYLTWKYSHPETAGSLPFLSSVEVSMISPYHVQIRVYEKTIAGYLLDSGSRVYFDTDGYVVEISGEERSGIWPFSGIDIGQPIVGAKLPVADPTFLDDISEAARLLHQSGLVPDEVHYDNNQELIVYFGSSRVLLGDASYMEDKIQELSALFSKLEGLSGTLHMENYTPDTVAISFIPGEQGEEELIIDLNKPEQDAEGETEPESDQGGADGAGQKTGDSGYVEDPNRFSTDASGAQIYTDEAGNVTSNMDKMYLGDDGKVITDGYGYIDPYTGAYILN